MKEEERKNKGIRGKAWKKKPTTVRSPKVIKVHPVNAKKTAGNSLQQKYLKTMMLLNERRKRKSNKHKFSDLERAKCVSEIS